MNCANSRFFFIPLFLLVLMGLSGSVNAARTDFTLPDLNGKASSLSDFRGKWVVVNYWATWCPPCLTEIPELVNFHEDNQANNAVVLGVNFEEIDSTTLKQFVDDYFINYPVLRERPGRESVMGEIPGLPTTFLVSPQGEIVARQVGGVTAALIEEFISNYKKKRVAPPQGY